VVKYLNYLSSNFELLLMAKKSTKVKKVNNKEIKQEDEFVAPPVDSFDETKFLRIRKYAFIFTFSFIALYLAIVIGFWNERGLMSTIVAWFCTFVWIIPILWFQMRYYKFSSHILEDEKIAKIYTLVEVYFIFVFVACFISLILALKVGPPYLLTPIIEWVFFIGLLPAFIVAYVKMN
jgi:hypothetical protein